MTFLSLWSGLLAAAIALPLLLLLYFLRLRRQRLRIPSTLLWQKSFEDLQANVPFQRLRWSLLLLLQLLLLAALLLALAQPVLHGEAPLAARVVLLIDRSASMNAIMRGAENATPRTRLDAAKDAARQIINNIGRRDEPSQMMIIAFGSSAQVVSTFDSNRDVLLDSIDSIQPTDEQADHDAALQLAGAFAGTREERQEQPPDVVLLSDGGVGAPADAAAFSLRAGNFRFVQVMKEQASRQQGIDASVDNLGIVALSVRRDYDDPARVLVFARLVNVGAQAVPTVATLLVDDQPVTTFRKSVPPATSDGLGEETISHALDLPGGAVLTLRHNHADDLAADDAAWLVLPAPARPRIALVHPDDAPADQFLHDLLDALEPQRLDVISQQAYSTLDAKAIDSGELYDLVVFDRVSVARLPDTPTLTIGGTPGALGNAETQKRKNAETAASSAPLAPGSAGGSGGGTVTGGPSDTPASRPQASTGRPILSWDRQHPVMRNVSLDTIVYADFGAYELPSGATPLAFGPDGPIIVELHTRGARHVAVGFAMSRSNWPLHVSSAVFMQNVVDYLTLARSGQNGLVFRPGEPITARLAAEARGVAIVRIDDQTIAGLDAGIGEVGGGANRQPAGDLTMLPALRRAGLYAAQGVVAPFDRIAVSVLSDVESDIRPALTVPVNAEAAAGQSPDRAAARPMWPWLVGLALALLVIEWLVYCRRARG